MDIVYAGPCLDVSGYAEAARNYIASLHSVGVNINVLPISFESFKSDTGEMGNLAKSLIKNKVNNKIQILHMTPENYPKMIKKDKYNIGYAAWETSELPAFWVPLINQLDEVWVPCKQNAKVFKDSGITKPIHVFPHSFNKKHVFDAEDCAPVVSIPEDTFTFYSIFQWTERKHPFALLKAYLTEFTADDKVKLLIKTYMIDPRNTEQVQRIKELINVLKGKLYMDSFPKILLVTSLLDRAQIQNIHHISDCYVSPHRGEGFGIPIAEAMLAGNPVIATPYGGPDDFIKHEETGYLINYTETPVWGMPWPIYKGTGVWAEPDIMDLRKHMRTVYNNREKSKQIGLAGKEWIEKNLSWQTVGLAMKKRLEQIEVELNG